jgi:hypothetical protein
VHRIGARAEKKVTQELIGEFRRVAGKENLLFRVAEASVARPDGMVKDVIFPAVGGEGTLRERLSVEIRVDVSRSSGMFVSDGIGGGRRERPERRPATSAARRVPYL